MAQWTPQQLQQMAALLQGTHNNLAVDQALAGAPTQRWAVDAQGQRVDPYGANPALAAIESASPAPQMTAPSPAQGYAPSAPRPMAPQPVARSTGHMRFNPLMGTPAGALLSLFGGKGQRPGGLMELMARGPAPGSVAAMELKHSGASRNPQSGSPAGTREYASGGR